MAWLLGPSSLCRQHLILGLIKKIKPETILEIGFGSGNLLLRLNALNFKGVGIDISKTAVKQFKEGVRNKKLNFTIKNMAAEDLVGYSKKFHLILASEVLEHIKDDIKDLKIWSRLLGEDGYLLISVPAHMSKWGNNDDYAGHVRRYEKEELINKLKKARFEVVKFFSYGYPVLNIIKKISDFMIKKKVRKDISLSERTKESGIQKVNSKLIKFLFNNFTLYLVFLSQKLFLNYDLGVGYIVLAKKKH